MISKIVIVVWTLCIVYLGLTSIVDMDVTQSDTAFALEFIFILIFHSMLWCVVGIPTALISMVFRRAAPMPAAGPRAPVIDDGAAETSGEQRAGNTALVSLGIVVILVLSLVLAL